MDTLIGLVTGLAVSVVCVFIFKWLMSPGKNRNLPPGPRSLPVIGNLLQVRKGPMAVIAKELADTYGPVLSLWLGSTLIVIITGAEEAHEALIKKGAIVNARPWLPSLQILAPRNRNITFGSGKRWQFLRKVLVQEVLSNSRLPGYQPIRNKELDILLDKIRKEAKENGVVIPMPAIRHTVLNILVNICFEERLEHEDSKDLGEALGETIAMLGGIPSDHIPLLRLLTSSEKERQHREKLQNLLARSNKYIVPLVEKRRKRMAAGGTPLGYVDTLLEIQASSQSSKESGIGESIELTDSDINLLVREMLNAGGDTTGITVEFALANLILHPEMQEKLFNEIHKVVGNRKIVDEDIPNLPYLRAVILETLRLHPPAWINPPRVTIEDCKLAGYDIPAGTLVLVHSKMISTDPASWDRPLEFTPERFLQNSVDITGTSEVTMIPFGAGRRICPGMTLGLLHTQLILARLVQTFEWHTSAADPPIDFTPNLQFTVHMQNPLKASVIDRQHGSINE